MAADDREWRAMPPYAEPPRASQWGAVPGGLPWEARLFLDRLDAWAERMVARYPALEAAIRREYAVRTDCAD